MIAAPSRLARWGLALAAGAAQGLSIVVPLYNEAAGLAVLHGLLEESRGKGPLLFALYFALSVFPPILVLLAGLGFADAFTDLRGRKAPVNPS